MIKTLARRIARKVLRGIVQLSYDDKGIQVLQVTALDGDTYEMPRIQQYGLTSNPHKDAEVVITMLNDSAGLIIAVDDARYRLKGMAQGEVALYDDTGNKVHLKRGGKMHLAAPVRVDIETPLAQFSGDVKALGDITDKSADNTLSVAAMRDVFDDHDHNETNSTTNKPNQKMVPAS
ncbi:phage baseplate assembly protein domain-containing protein [Aliamphritea ceti]|uniref:phage baseplate assembly protein domain-containing protein n=1 Tax=Aliamphritea ceti TaxID=1524258 RepID=UPI0021C43012|nr:phage baseplate assembly protein [Aliamphritea ceti]